MEKKCKTTVVSVSTLFAALSIGISSYIGTIGPNDLLTPWKAIGGCGTISKDSLVGNWKWLQSCPDTSTACILQASVGYNKHLRFTMDSVYTSKNDSLIAVTVFDSNFINSTRGIAGAGINNGKQPISFIAGTPSDTLWMQDSCYGENKGCSYHIYAKEKIGVIRYPAATLRSGKSIRHSDRVCYFTLKGERTTLRSGQTAHHAVLILRDPISGESRKIISPSRIYPK
jgi:hypothetical protein